MFETAALQKAREKLAGFTQASYTPQWAKDDQRFKQVYAHVLAVDKVVLEDSIAKKQGQWSASKANRHIVTGPQTELEQRRQKSLQGKVALLYTQWCVCFPIPPFPLVFTYACLVLFRSLFCLLFSDILRLFCRLEKDARWHLETGQPTPARPTYEDILDKDNPAVFPWYERVIITILAQLCWLT